MVKCKIGGYLFVIVMLELMSIADIAILIMIDRWSDS